MVARRSMRTYLPPRAGRSRCVPCSATAPPSMTAMLSAADDDVCAYDHSLRTSGRAGWRQPFALPPAHGSPRSDLVAPSSRAMACESQRGRRWLRASPPGETPPLPEEECACARRARAGGSFSAFGSGTFAPHSYVRVLPARAPFHYYASKSVESINAVRRIAFCFRAP